MGVLVITENLIFFAGFSEIGVLRFDVPFGNLSEPSGCDNSKGYITLFSNRSDIYFTQNFCWLRNRWGRMNLTYRNFDFAHTNWTESDWFDCEIYIENGRLIFQISDLLQFDPIFKNFSVLKSNLKWCFCGGININWIGTLRCFQPASH